MYTQCPHCQTCFRIAEAHLKAAKGKVRCGSCKEVFDATNHLYKTLPDAEAATKPPVTKTKPAPPPPATPQPKVSTPPLPGISSAFGDDEHEHIDLSAPSPERENAPDQSPFMESLVGRYNNLDDMGNINIPGESPMTDSFIRFADEDDAITGQPSTADTSAATTDTDFTADKQSETDEAIANIKAQLSEFGLDNDEIESASLTAEPDEERTPYEDVMAPDQPANTMERNAIDDMFQNVEDQLDSPMMQDDQGALNANINALLDDAMALDDNSQNDKPKEKEKAKPPKKSLPAEDPIFGLDDNSDFINDSLQNADETLAQFEAELEDMKLEPQIDENVSVFDIDHADPPAGSAEEEPVNFEQFGFNDLNSDDLPGGDAPNTADELPSVDDKPEQKPQPEPKLKQDEDDDLLENFLMDEDSASIKEPEQDSIEVASNQFDDDFLGGVVEQVRTDIPTDAPEAKKVSKKDKSVDLKVNDEASKEELPSAEHDIPKALRSSFENFELPTRPMWLNISMAAGIFVLIIGLLSQVIIFRSYQLANSFPGMSPMLSNFCETFSCRYSGEIDVEQIQLINRNVSTHPNQKNALLISTAFVNKASFNQPYPTIAIKLSDLSGETVATRYFRPEEYLENLYNKFLLMESGTPVHITLAVLDPGNDAVNFEFSFL